MKKQFLICAILLLFVFSSGLYAAFIVEPSGLASDHFSGSTPHFSSPGGGAPGLTAATHAWGSYNAFPDIYQFSYTPGTDADNWDVPDGNRYFGNGLYSTQLDGSQTGYYNVYITWSASTNVSSLCDITITSEGADIVWTDINMNTGGTDAFAQTWGPFPAGSAFYGGNNKWLKIADQVLLNSGNTYTVTQAAQNDTYVSMRSAGVMWEFVAVPEPATILLLSLGGFAVARRTRK